VLLKQGIGVVRYYGKVDFDETQNYFGIELKGPPIAGGHNGNGYFKTRGGDGRGIFVLQPIRVISSEEILEKLAEIYDILKGRRGHSHFIDRATYDELLLQHEQLKEELSDKTSLLDDLNMELALCKEQIAMMKGTLGDKIEETAKMNEKITEAEKKVGSRLSQITLDSVVNQLQREKQQTGNDGGAQPPLQIPDYSQTTSSKHRKQRSSTTLELDQLNDDFGDIARSVEAFGQKDIKIAGPTHYRKFSNTTKQVLESYSKNAGMSVGQFNRYHGSNTFGMLQDHQEEEEEPSQPVEPVAATNINGVTASKPTGKGHRARGSMKIADIVDENGIDYGSDEEQANQNDLHRDSADEAEENEANHSKQRTKRTRQSRESRQLNDNEVNQGDYFEDEYDGNEPAKRTQKTRQSRESRQLDDEQVVQGMDEGESEEEEDVNMEEASTANKRVAKPRAARDSMQINDNQVDQYEEDDDDEDVDDELLDDNLHGSHNSNGKQRIVSAKKARGSFQLEQPILSASAVETHNGLNGMNGAAGGTEQSAETGKAHKKSDTMTSDSSAYRAFMTVD